MINPISIPYDKPLHKIREECDVAEVIERYELLTEDLFLARNPRFKFNPDFQNELLGFRQSVARKENVGQWFYFTWSKLLVYYLHKDLHRELRTARNRNLITADEQAALLNLRVAIGGLSVGSHAVLTLAMIGGGHVFKIADPDVIAPSNLNRIRNPFTDVGQSKTDAVAQFLYELDPYFDVVRLTDGLTRDNVDDFVSGVDVVVDAVDNLELKIRLRLAAREHGVPVIMATDNGDNIIIDVERYDLDTSLELFNGAIGHVTLEQFQEFPLHDLPKLATRIAGAELVVPRMLESVAEVGRTLYSWPQLGTAATLAGVATAYAIKRIALRQPIKTGKFDVSLDAIFDPTYLSAEAIAHREVKRAEALTRLGIN